MAACLIQKQMEMLGKLNIKKRARIFSLKDTGGDFFLLFLFFFFAMTVSSKTVFRFLGCQ